MRVLLLLTIFAIFQIVPAERGVAEVPRGDIRQPANEEDLEFWLRNMVLFHRFNVGEISSATGLSEGAVREACAKFKLEPDTPSKGGRPESASGALTILPYPGGRHPRIGFLEGAIAPQRETKFSAFAPWDRESYVVVDLPEAIWSNLGLTYLAHTHIPTIWSKQQIELDRLEWKVGEAGSLALERRLPNGIRFSTLAKPFKDGIRMRMSLTNGTREPLSDLRVQMCTMLKGARGFTSQTNENKLFLPPLSAVHDEGGSRWIITGWEPVHRVWGNSKCPCLHADPKFPDCPPGETREVLGWLSFYEGSDIYGELCRVYRTDWRIKD